MYTIGVHYRISQIISMYYIIGLLHTNNRSKFRKYVSQIVNLCASGYFPMSFLVGSFLTDDKIESIFSKVESLLSFVISVRLFYFLSKKDEILSLVRTLGTFSIRDSDDFRKFNNQINVFVKFSVVSHSMVIFSIIMWVTLALPIISLGTPLPLNIYFPILNSKDNEISRWIAIGVITFNMIFAGFHALLNVIVWYLMMCCEIQYRILGNDFRNLCTYSDAEIEERKSQYSIDGNKDIDVLELIVVIKAYQNLRKATVRLAFCFSNLFFIQILTSGITICGTVYVLAFISIQNPFHYYIIIAAMMYSFLDIFMVTYFGNEIKFWSSNLSYCLFQSNWMDQSKYSKECMVILMELLKRPQVLLVGKVYRLDLEIFKKILNFAYSMFNVLKNVK